MAQIETSLQSDGPLSYSLKLSSDAHAPSGNSDSVSQLTLCALQMLINRANNVLDMIKYAGVCLHFKFY